MGRLPGLDFGGFDRGAFGGVEADRSFREVRLGHKFGAKQGYKSDACYENNECQRQGEQLVSQRPAQYALIEVREPIAHALHPGRHAPQRAAVQAFAAMFAMGVDCRVMPDAGEHRVQREADEHGDQHGRHDGDAELMEELPDDAPHKAYGQKYGDDGKRGGEHGQPDLLRAFHGGLIGVLAHLHMAHDVLAHHDGIVDQQTHTQR